MFTICWMTIGLVSPSIVLAQDDAKGPKRDSSRLFDRLDGNKDGSVTKDEVPEERQRLFTRLVRSADKNGDGKLTSEEFNAGLQDDRRTRPDAPERPRPGGPDRPGGAMVGPAALMRVLDADGDGAISKSEIDEAPKALKKLDRNGDGQLTREELGPRGGVQPPAVRPGQAAGALMERIRNLDENNDGKWTKDELPERFQEQFDTLDANKDGSLDREELSRLARQLRGGGRAGKGPVTDRPEKKKE
jgi:Ca2+-binding EF-hand superfamily protein